jgi:hypothetical protein
VRWRFGRPPPLSRCSNSSSTRAGSPTTSSRTRRTVSPAGTPSTAASSAGAPAKPTASYRWTAGHPLLPALAPVLAAEGFERDRLTGIKIFFGNHNGQEIAEVCVNGRVSEAASQALLALDWPRRDVGGAYARTFVLLVHADEPADVPSTPGTL